MSTRLLGPLCFLPAVALGGCGGYLSPRVSVTEAYVAARTDEGTVVNVVINATNPNEDPMPLRHVSYSAAVDGEPAAAVARWATVNVAGKSTVRFELPVVTRHAGGGAEPVTISGRVEFVPEGRVRALLAELGVPLPQESFAGATTVDLSAAPRAARNTATRVFGGEQVSAPEVPVGDTLKPLPR